MGWWDLLGRPWTPSEKDEQADALDAVGADYGRRGFVRAGGIEADRERVRARLNRYRLGLRTLALLALLVVGFTVASQFTDNRFVDSIPSAAAAAAVPVALLLGLRRPGDGR